MRFQFSGVYNPFSLELNDRVMKKQEQGVNEKAFW